MDWDRLWGELKHATHPAVVIGPARLTAPPSWERGGLMCLIGPHLGERRLRFDRAR
jgi:hypothetical protein